MGLSKSGSLIGLATRGGKTVSGDTAVLSAIRDGTARLVIISEEASERTRKKFHDKCAYYRVSCIEHGTLEELGRAVGKPFRAVAAVTDEGLAGAVLKAFGEDTTMS